MTSWSEWRVSTRLSLAFGLAGATCITLLVGSWIQQRNADAAIAELTHTEMVRLQTVMSLRALCNDTTPRVIALNRSKDPAIAKMFGPEVEPRVKRIAAMEVEIRGWMTSPAEQAWFKEFNANAERIREHLIAIEKARASNDDAAADKTFDEAFLPAVNRYGDRLTELVEMQQNRFNAQAAELQRSGWLSWTIAAIAGLTMLGAAGVLVVALVRAIGRALRESNRIASEVAHGNLTVQADARGRDEFAQLNLSLNGMAAALNKVVVQVRNGSDHIATASQEIAQGNQDLSERTERQASQLQEAASTMEELASTVRQTATSATQADELSAKATEVAKRGSEAVNLVVATMSEIEQSSRRIGDIIGVIDGISFQTNILALNAAVEAARAGEQGRGFAVVAGEVRQLAQRSASAAKEIKQLIADSADKVQAGSGQVQKAGQTMLELQLSVGQVTTLIAEINAAAEGQRRRIAGVSHSVSDLDRSTQQNSALVEQSAAAAAAMREQASKLAEMVATFRLANVA